MLILTRTAPMILTAVLALTGCRATSGDHAMADDKMAGDHAMTDTMAKDGAMSGDHAMTDTMAAKPGDSMMKALSGDFKTQHAPTTGRASLNKGADGRYSVTITNLKTEPAPDLHVWLLPAGDTTDSPELRKAKYIDLGTIETTVASKTLAVPAGISVDGYTNVVLWCDQFSVAFATAALK